ncbi:hypothetical protein Efla_001483 [Eimeria flavescens]
MDAAQPPIAVPASASPAGSLLPGLEGRATPQPQQGSSFAASSAQGVSSAYSIAVRPPPEVSSTGVALLHQELLLYVLRRCSPVSRPSEASLSSPDAALARMRPSAAAAAATAAALPLLHASGFRVGSRVAERLTLKCCRMPEQRECVKFVCKDLWHFLFQKQADRLQTNRRGGYVIHDANLPWLRRVCPFAAAPSPPAAAAAAAAAAGKSAESLQQQYEDELLRTAATQPQLHVAFVYPHLFLTASSNSSSSRNSSSRSNGRMSSSSSNNNSSSRMRNGCGRCAAMCTEVFDSLRDLRDPEFPAETLEDLQVVARELIVARCTGSCSRHGTRSSISTSSRSSLSGKKHTADAPAAYTEPWEEEDCSTCCSRCSSNSSSFELDSSSSSSSVSFELSDVEGCMPECRCCCVVVSVHPTSPRCSFASLLGLLVRCRLALDFSPTDAASLALNNTPPFNKPPAAAAAAEGAATPGAAAAEGAAAAGEAAGGGRGAAARGGELAGDEGPAVGAWGVLPFAVPRLSLWIRVCAHEASEALTKQLNDKERIAAALSTPYIRTLILSGMELKEG